MSRSPLHIARNIALKEGTNEELPVWLARIVKESDSCDITVRVGTTTEFKLHRHIVCAKSSYFKAACKECFKEGRDRVITLPEVDLTAFGTVLKSVYGETYKFPEDYYYNPAFVDSVAKAWEAADYLGVDDFLDEVLDEVEKAAFDYVQYIGFTGIREIGAELIALIRKLRLVGGNRRKARLAELLVVLIVVNDKEEWDDEWLEGGNDFAVEVCSRLCRAVSKTVCLKCRILVAIGSAFLGQEEANDECFGCGSKT